MLQLRIAITLNLDLRDSINLCYLSLVILLPPLRSNCIFVKSIDGIQIPQVSAC